MQKRPITRKAKKPTKEGFIFLSGLLGPPPRPEMLKMLPLIQPSHFGSANAFINGVKTYPHGIGTRAIRVPSQDENKNASTGDGFQH